MGGNHEHSSGTSEYKEPLGYKIWNSLTGKGGGSGESLNSSRKQNIRIGKQEIQNEDDLKRIASYANRKDFIRSRFNKNYSGTTQENLSLLQNERLKSAYLEKFSGATRTSRSLRDSLKQEVTSFTAPRKFDPSQTTKMIERTFGNVDSVILPRSSGKLETAFKKSDGLFYFAGSQNPCYLDKGEGVILNNSESQETPSVAVNTVTRKTNFNFNQFLPWNWSTHMNLSDKKKTVQDKTKQDAIESTRNLSGAAKKVVSLAIEWAQSGAVKGAAHCTDWVDRVFKIATGGTVHGTEKCIYNKVGKFAGGGTGLTGQPASREMLARIKPGDHLMVQWRPGRTHSAIAIGEPQDGIITVASWPGSGSSRIETYDLYGLGRAKNVAGGVLRIQRPGYSEGSISA